MEQRINISYSLFVRRAVTCIIMNLICVITTLFSLFLVPTLIPWTSWEHAHENMGKAVVLTVPDEVSNTRLTWWTVFAMSVAYVLLSFAVGEETRDSAKWIHKTWLRRNEFFDWMRSLRYVILTEPSNSPSLTPHFLSGFLDLLFLVIPQDHDNRLVLHVLSRTWSTLGRAGTT